MLVLFLLLLLLPSFFVVDKRRNCFWGGLAKVFMRLDHRLLKLVQACNRSNFFVVDK